MISKLLREFDPVTANRVVSPQMGLISVKNERLDVTIRSMDPGGPVAVPHGRVALMSIMAAPQIPVTDDGFENFNYEPTYRQVAELRSWFRDNVVDVDSRRIMPIAKPELHLDATSIGSGVMYPRDSRMAVQRVSAYNGLIVSLAGKYSFDQLLPMN